MGEAVRVKVIASKPVLGQSEITEDIGKEFDVLTGQLSADGVGEVAVLRTDGRILLNLGEWEEIK